MVCICTTVMLLVDLGEDGGSTIFGDVLFIISLVGLIPQLFLILKWNNNNLSNVSKVPGPYKNVGFKQFYSKKFGSAVSVYYPAQRSNGNKPYWLGDYRKQHKFLRGLFEARKWMS